MKDQMNPGQKLVQFLYSIGLPPARIRTGLITLLVIGAILGGVYFLNFDSFRSASGRDGDSDTELVENGRTTDELDQQINELTFIDPRELNYVVLYGEVEKQNEAIDELRKRSDITTEQTGKLDEIQLRNLRNLYMQTLGQGSSADIERESFETFANKLLSSSNEKSKDSAGFDLTRLAVNVFSRKPNADDGQAALDALNQHQSSYVNNNKRALFLLRQLLTCQQQNPGDEVARNCVATLGKILATSTDDKIQDLAKDIVEVSLFKGLEIGRLEKRIRFQDRQALADLDNALRVLESHPELAIEKWELLMRSYEAALSTGRVNVFNTAKRIMGELVAKLPDSDERKTRLLNLLTRQKQRAQQLGKPMDLTGVTLDGKQIVQSNAEFSVLCLLDRSRKSVELVKSLSKSQSQLGTTFRPILAYKDKHAKEDKEKASTFPPKMLFADNETAAKYLASFPTDFFPYLLLIDKNGILVAGNLSPLQVENRIAALNKRNSAAPTLGQ